MSRKQILCSGRIPASCVHKSNGLITNMIIADIVCGYCLHPVHVINRIIISDNENTIMYSGSIAQSIWRDVQPSSWPFHSIPRHVPFLSPTRHCTKWCFVSRQQTVSPPLVTPVSALPCCPMASAPIRIYCGSLLLLAGRGLCPANMSNVKGVLWPCTHSDTSRWLETVGGGPREKKKNTHSQKTKDEHGKVWNAPLTSRK